MTGANRTKGRVALAADNAVKVIEESVAVDLAAAANKLVVQLDAVKLVVERLGEKGVDDLADAKASMVVKLLTESLTELAQRCLWSKPDEPARLNFILSDGSNLLAGRWNNSLYKISREGIYECEICGNKVKVLESGAGTLVCCGQPMNLVE